MAMYVQKIPGAGFLTVVVTGDFSLSEAQRTFADVVDAIAEHKSEKVVFDGRRISGQPEAIERFYYGEYAAEMCHKHLYSGGKQRIVPRFAYVLKHPVLDPQRFGETVARNRGMIVRVFDNLAEAYQWLGLPLTATPDWERQ